MAVCLLLALGRREQTQLSEDGCCLRFKLDVRMDTCGTVAEDRNSNRLCWKKNTGVKDNFLNGISSKRYNILTQEEGRYIYDPKFLGGHCESVYNGEWRALRYDATCERLYYGDDEKYFLKPYNFHIYQFLVSTRMVKFGNISFAKKPNLLQRYYADYIRGDNSLHAIFQITLLQLSPRQLTTSDIKAVLWHIKVLMCFIIQASPLLILL